MRVFVFSGGILIHYICHFSLAIILLDLFIGRNVPLKISLVPSFYSYKKSRGFSHKNGTKTGQS